MNPVIDDRLLAELLDRAGDPEGFARFEAQGESCGWCREPVRLSGRVTEVDGSRRDIVYTTASEPDGVLLKACGSRRATRCPSCSDLYLGDARQLIGAGLRGGKGVPETVTTHPAIFATFTAPSFGAVHGRRQRGGRIQPCRTGSPKERCLHGRPLSCWVRHADDDPTLGEPLCAECFDYERAVLWNSLSSELWRRTTIYLRRMLARLVGLGDKELRSLVRVSFSKVVEYQRRGVVHVHAVIRLDGVGEELSPPPAPFDASLLELAARLAARQVAVRYPEGATSGLARWGTQVDVRVVRSASAKDPAPGAVANYIAKYATKSADDSGAFDRRFRGPADLSYRDLPAHLGRLAKTAWDLGGREELASLNLHRWAHDLGHRGHWLTKSRRWSTTFCALRAERHVWRVAQFPVPQSCVAQSTASSEPDRQLPERVRRWKVVGFGWRTSADAYFARARSRQRRETRRLARDGRREMEAA
jgi:hypothetical protein